MFRIKESPYIIPLTYGVYGAILSSVFYFVLLFSGNSPWSSSSWMGSWIPAVAAFFTIKRIQTAHQDVSFPFFSVFKIAWITIFIQALAYNLLTFILGYIIGDTALDMYKAEVVENVIQLKTVYGEDMVDKMMLEMENISLISLAFTDFILKLIGGAIVSLILAGIYKDKNY